MAATRAQQRVYTVEKEKSVVGPKKTQNFCCVAATGGFQPPRAAAGVSWKGGTKRLERGPQRGPPKGQNGGRREDYRQGKRNGPAKKRRQDSALARESESRPNRVTVRAAKETNAVMRTGSKS